MTGTQPSISQAPPAMFQAARAEAEAQVSIKLCAKLDEFFELEGYDWFLVEPMGHALAFITDMIAFLNSTSIFYQMLHLLHAKGHVNT